MRRSALCRRPRNRGCAVRALVARYYDPAAAAFLTRDPLEAQTEIPYSYANDDPLDEADPRGLDGCSILNPIACLAPVLKTDWDYYQCHWRSVVGGGLSGAGDALGWVSSAIPGPVGVIGGGISVIWKTGGTLIQTKSRGAAQCAAAVSSLEVVGGILESVPGKALVYATIGESLCDPTPAYGGSGSS